MGTLEVDKSSFQIRLASQIFLYGDAISEIVRRDMEEEIMNMWNEVRGLVWLNNYPFLLNFDCQVYLFPDLQPVDIVTNTNPRNNYFRIEEFVHGNISFVDGLGSNTGFFKLENLYKNSTTAAHEYGHTLGLPHPTDLDLRGKGIPGIMYPRGTLVNPEFQYEPNATPGEKGGTMYPIHRKVLQSDIDDLQIAKLLNSNQQVIGKFSSVFHYPHENHEKNTSAIS